MARFPCPYRIAVLEFRTLFMRTLFQPFHRSSDPYRQETTGIGLGLVISLRVAELHGGTVHLDSVAGEGTSAVLTLPADRVISITTEESSMQG